MKEEVARKIIPTIVKFVLNGVAFIELPAWADTLFIVLICGFVILLPLVGLIIFVLNQKIRLLRADKQLKISFSFILYGASYLVYIIGTISVFESIDHWSRISSFIPGVAFSFGGSAYPIMLIGGMVLSASLLVGNLIWFLIRRRKIRLKLNLKEKTLEGESTGN